MSKKVIITGINGQDGRYLARHILSTTDYDVVGTTNPENHHIPLEFAGESRITFRPMDLLNELDIRRTVQEEKPDYFINFAAQSSVAASVRNPELTFEVNALGVARVLEALEKDAPKCCFYNAGSSEQFSSFETPYSISKRAAHEYVNRARRKGLFAIQGITFNHESEKRSDAFLSRKITKGVARIRAAVENQEPFEPIILGNLEISKDWSHAEDIVKGIWLMINNNEPKDYTLASGQTHSVREFTELAFCAAGIRVMNTNRQKVGPAIGQPLGYQINYILDGNIMHPVVVVSRELFRPNEPIITQGAPELARKELGWTPQISFASLVERMVDADIYLTREAKGVK